MTPEQRIALRLLGGAAPPVDVDAIARQVADVEYDSIPTRADAVLLHASRQRTRPLIILDAGRPEVRVRFTLAHELGHIAIPWHIGEIAYHQDWSGRFGNYEHREMEAEANRFASEILMPGPWVDRIVERSSTPSEMFAEVRSARVSGQAAAIALLRHLPTGYVLAQADRETAAVTMSGKSAGTLAVPPSEGRLVDKSFYKASQAQHEAVTDRTSIYHWWRFPSEGAVIEPSHQISSRELLERIYGDLGIAGEDKKKLDYRISGIVGSANSRLGKIPWRQRYAVLNQAFAGRSGLPPLEHPDFDTFLALRAKEISDRA